MDRARDGEEARERERETDELSGVLEWRSNFHLQKQGL